MSKLTAAYVAGLIDGEGCLEIQKKDTKYQARIRICMTDEKMIKWLQESFGGYFETRKFNNDAWKDAYGWTIKNNIMVKPFIEKICPYLKLKKPQAEIIKEFLKTFNSKSYNEIRHNLQNNGIGIHRELKNETIDYREKLYQEIRLLNKRGKSVQSERLNKASPSGVSDSLNIRE